MSTAGCQWWTVLVQTPMPGELSFVPLINRLHVWQGLAQLLWSSFSVDLFSEALSQSTFGQAGHPKKWEQFPLHIFARVWLNTKNDFVNNWTTLWWMFSNKTKWKNTWKTELPSSKEIQMDFLTSFCTNISFMFLEIAGESFISVHISILGLGKFLSCASKSSTCRY